MNYACVEAPRPVRIPNLGLRLLAVVVCLGILGYFWFLSTVPAELKTGHVDITADYMGFSSLEEMEARADMVLEAVKLEEVETGYSETLSRFRITGIHRDPTGTLAVGDVITVAEPVGYSQEDRVYRHLDGYELTVSGCGYLLFLTGENGTYGPVGFHYGVVPLEEDGRYTVWDPEYGRFDDIWQAAIEKYVG